MAQQIRPTKLVAFFSLPGTGNTTIPRLLAERLHAVHLRIDASEPSLLHTASRRQSDLRAVRWRKALPPTA